MPVGMRRQNHSCDQCRKAKRACDAPSLREAARRGPVPDCDSLVSELQHRACSYCLKTNKHCTLDWARSQLQANQGASAARSTEHRRTKRPRKAEQAKAVAVAAAASAAPPEMLSTPSSSVAPEAKPVVAPVLSQPQQPQQHQQQQHQQQQQQYRPPPPPPPQQQQQQQHLVFPTPPPTLTPASLPTSSEMGDAGASASASATVSAPNPTSLPSTSVDMSFWPAPNPLSFQNIPNLDSFNAMTPQHHQHQHHPITPFADNVTLPLGFASGGAHGATSLMGMAAFDTLPVTTSELVSRPAFHSMAPEPSALWSMLPAQTSVDQSHQQQHSHQQQQQQHQQQHQTVMGLSPPEVFATMNGEEEDAASSSAMTDGFALHRAPFGQQKFGGAGAGSVAGTRRMSYSAMVSPAPTNAVEYMMASRFNNHNISENLLQIYHDVLEHNLTCWITEETCPYNIWARPAKQKQLKALAGGNGNANGNGGNGSGMGQHQQVAAVGGRRSWEPHQTYKSQFGPNWSNRVYRRVTKLDKIAQDTGIMRLSRAQNQASQKALHLVIMAFATQWAQGSQRQRESYAAGGGFGGGAAGIGSAYASSDEFDRSIQRSLWHQARAALQECADIESYRVVCAELIFGLTQRPWEEFEFAELELKTNHAAVAGVGSGMGTANGNGNGTGTGNDEPLTFAEARQKREAILSKLSEVFQKDGPPVYIERAARKMHALKSKFDNYELGFLGDDAFGSSSNNINGNGNKDVTTADTSTPKTTTEDGQTVGLLFWMAAMFDTISASLSERPAVLADDESQHEAAEHELMFPGAGFHAGSPDSGGSSENDNVGAVVKKNNRWRIDLFIQDNPERMTTHQYHYPCSYEDAAHNITHATPVKVLLYRQVLYLQNMLRKPYLTKGRPTEEIVGESLMIYRYWNIKYGAFFRELIQHYASVPARIRGWFVCILAHWHLGALLFADVLETVDKNGVGLDENRQMRTAASTVANIRRTSAMQLSDLARVATPLMPGSAADPAAMPDFHFAVREGTILTEPWTILLIRAFSKASIIHLREADNVRQPGSTPDLLGHDSEAYHESLRRSEDCIQALWYLGKKSDMARNVAVVLFRAMNVQGS